MFSFSNINNIFATELENSEEDNLAILNEELRQIKKGNVELNVLRDNDGLTQIQIEKNADENIIRFDIEVSNAAVEQLTVQDGKIEPTTDNDVNLGSSSLEFKNLYIDDTANIDSLILSTGVTATEIEDNDSLGTSDVKLCTQGNVKAYVDGQISGISSDEIADADDDTKIQVEEGSDDDTIRFDCANSEQMVLTDGQLEPTTTSDIFLGSSTKQFKFIIENRTDDNGCTETGRIWIRTD